MSSRNRIRSLSVRRAPSTLHSVRPFVLNYHAMKRLKLSTYSGLVVLVALLLGCSTPEENAGSSNTNASAQANSNTAPQIAQSNAPNGPTAVQPPPSLPSAESSPPANANAGAAPPAPVNPRAQKLVVSDKKLDFGKQPQDKSLVRAIVVRNGGHEELKIESVVPS